MAVLLIVEEGHPHPSFHKVQKTVRSERKTRACSFVLPHHLVLNDGNHGTNQGDGAIDTQNPTKPNKPNGVFHFSTFSEDQAPGIHQRDCIQCSKELQ